MSEHSLNVFVRFHLVTAVFIHTIFGHCLITAKLSKTKTTVNNRILCSVEMEKKRGA